MNDFPPLPHFLTLGEAAQAVADRTGKPWTARQILGCAERHEITVFARIDRAAKFVRVQPTDGRTNKIAADAGSLPILGAKAVQALLLTGEASSTGWEEPATVDFFGEPMRAWARAFELAQGEEPPRVGIDDCRVTDGRAAGPQHEQGFAASTAAAAGMTKQAINQHLARAEALGDALQRITGTSLDKGVRKLRPLLPARAWAAPGFSLETVSSEGSPPRAWVSPGALTS